MRIGIARLWHEANAFSPAITRMAQFKAREWVRGEDAVPLFDGTATEIGGALAWQRSRPDVELVFSRCASAAPAGPVDQALLDAFTAEVAGDRALDGIDGLYLSLHGASIGTADLAPEESLLKALRRRFPDLPISASFDMHACLTPDIAAHLDAATVYRTYPHVDMAQAANDALDMLARIVAEGLRTQVVVRAIDRILPSFNMRTDGSGPMGEVEDIAVGAQTAMGDGRILAAYPFASFAYADVPAANSGVVVTCEDEAAGNRLADTVAAALFERRRAFIPDLASAEAVLASRPWANGRRVAILEPSDNPMSGGLGDTPGLFAAAMATDLPEGSVFAFFCDPGLAAKAHAAGEGASLEISLGGRLDRRFGEPVSCGATVLRLTDGHFRNAGPMEQGMRVNLGRTALLQAGRLRTIVTEGCQSPNDRNYFALHGIDIEAVPLLLAKAKNHFMAAFGGLFDEVRQCDTPGPAMADVSRLPFRHIPAERFDIS
ncbi:M81 family metallopeptidase [Stappia sp. F7233]|uniref:Microcystinase C n=1 Tax=Stappia albiluteola TaxID=2758565 RepID=A0A839AD08_9HYPH|nr:M81 family metallopeptidase [Stappia albiluteola]MBA5776854.1 M81 family metallopeptidase [Stappia albiluteola]